MTSAETKQILQRIDQFEAKMDAWIVGTPTTPGLDKRMDRLEQSENRRRDKSETASTKARWMTRGLVAGAAALISEADRLLHYFFGGR
jgi:hypothetical protein